MRQHTKKYKIYRNGILVGIGTVPYLCKKLNISKTTIYNAVSRTKQYKAGKGAVHRYMAFELENKVSGE